MPLLTIKGSHGPVTAKSVSDMDRTEQRTGKTFLLQSILSTARVHEGRECIVLTETIDPADNYDEGDATRFTYQQVSQSYYAEQMFQSIEGALSTTVVVDDMYDFTLPDAQRKEFKAVVEKLLSYPNVYVYLAGTLFDHAED
jgi:hypothetical protein